MYFFQPLVISSFPSLNILSITFSTRFPQGWETYVLNSFRHDNSKLELQSQLSEASDITELEPEQLFYECKEQKTSHLIVRMRVTTSCPFHRHPTACFENVYIRMESDHLAYSSANETPPTMIIATTQHLTTTKKLNNLRTRSYREK